MLPTKMCFFLYTAQEQLYYLSIYLSICLSNPSLTLLSLPLVISLFQNFCQVSEPFLLSGPPTRHWAYTQDMALYKISGGKHQFYDNVYVCMYLYVHTTHHTWKKNYKNDSNSNFGANFCVVFSFDFWHFCVVFWRPVSSFASWPTFFPRYGTHIYIYSHCGPIGRYNEITSFLNRMSRCKC